MKWLFAILLALAPLQGSAQEAGPGQLTVTGEGGISAVPDMATITLGVTNEAPTAAKALALTSSATVAVLDRLSAAGIAPRDMQTSDLSLSPVWDTDNSNRRPQISGFEASNNVTVRVLALDTLGAILDSVVEGGANNFRGLSFGLQDPGPILDQARRAAVAEAIRKAQLYADAAGLTLGPVMQLSESGGFAQPVMMERMAMAADVPIAQGEVTTQSSVTMVFAIGN